MKSDGLRERKKARTRDQIAEAALELFVQQGYNETTLEEIAETAEVHKRTLLRYFPSKSHLILHRNLSLLEKFKDTLRDRGRTPVLELWKNHVVQNAENIARRGDKLNMADLIAEVPELQREIVLIYQEYQQEIQRELEVDYPKLRKREVITHVAAAALVGANFSLASALQSRRQFGKLEESLLDVITLVEREILKA